MPVVKLANGKYEARVNYTVVRGRYKTVTQRADTRAEAVLAETRLRSMIVSSDVTLQALSEHYLSDMKANDAIGSYQVACNIVRKHIQPYWGDKVKARDITPLMIRQWQLHVQSLGFKESYLSTINGKLSAIYNYGVRYYGLIQNPVKEVPPMGRKTRNLANGFWRLDEFDRFIDAIKPDSPLQLSFILAFNLLYYGGIREGELLALVPDDVDLKAKTLSINKTYMVIGGKHIVHQPKTPSSNRVIALPNFLVKMLADYLPRLPTATCRLFRCLSKSSLAKMLHKTADAAGVKQITIHQLRHSHVALLLQMGVSIQEISKRLGHSSPEITYRFYSHLYPGSEAAIASKLDRVHSNHVVKG